MLCSSAVGTVEFRSLLEPVRVSNPEVTYLEASCFSLDPLGKVATCVQAALQPDGSPGQPFAVPYAACFVSCGEQTATYNTPGVPEHTFQLKEVGDAVALRRRIGEVFELAALPSTTPEQRADLLHFIVVGGGPTGVEFAGTLSDFVREDLAKRFPLPVRSAARVTLLQSGGAILGQFAEKLQESALATLAAEGVEVRLRSRVARVDPGAVTLAGGEVLRCGLVVWSVGNSARPLTAALSAALPAQRAFAPDPSAPSVKLAVDPWLRVAGARDLLAAGDCARLHGCPLPATAQAAAQQGAYAARLLSRGYALGVGGLDKPPPHRPAAAAGAGAAPASAWPTAAWEVAPVFEFLGLGLLACAPGWGEGGLGGCVAAAPFSCDGPFAADVGADSALTQVDAGLLQLQLSGPFAFLLWRSVYITKCAALKRRAPPPRGSRVCLVLCVSQAGFVAQPCAHSVRLAKDAPFRPGPEPVLTGRGGYERERPGGACGTGGGWDAETRGCGDDKTTETSASDVTG